MSMPYSECRSDLGFASPPVPPPCVFRNRIGCFRLQLSAGRLPLRPRTFVRLFFYSVGTSVLPYFALWGTRPLFNSGPAPTACPMIRSLAARICRLSDCPIVRSSAARRKPPPPSFPAALLGHLFFRTFAGVDRQVALQGLLQPHRVDVAGAVRRPARSKCRPSPRRLRR